MGELTVEEYYSLCGRLDTLEHLHEVLVAVAAQLMGPGGPDGEDGDADGEDDTGVPGGHAVADEPSGPVN
jgi:hypothetical protein